MEQLCKLVWAELPSQTKEMLKELKKLPTYSPRTDAVRIFEKYYNAEIKAKATKYCIFHDFRAGVWDVHFFK